MAKQPVPSNPERVRSHAHIDEQGPSPDVVAWQEPPKAAVVGLVTVIAHHPIMLRGDDDRPPVVCRRLIVSWIWADITRQLQGSHLVTILVVGIGSQRGVQRVRLLEAMPVADERVVHHLHAVSRGGAAVTASRSSLR